VSRLVFFLLLLAGPSFAQEVGAGLDNESPVAIEANELTYDEATSTYRASGQVQLHKGGVSLFSDRIQLNTATGEASAHGEVRLIEPGGLLEAEHMMIDLDSGQGRITNGHVLLTERNFHIAGSEIEKLGEQTYEVTNGSFTTCDGDVPAWKFSARKFNVTLGKYARAKHVIFYVHDIPLLYTPYLIYPVKTERESGLLTPRYGYSKKRGTELSLAYYQVIDRHLDATFYLDYLSDMGLGKGIEYRYIFGEDNEGVFKGYHINGFNDFDNRHALDWVHFGRLPGDVRLSADVEYVSSRDYFDDFGEVAEEYNKDKAQSVVTASRNWEKLNLTGQLKYTKDLEQNNDRTLQRLPEIDLTSVRRHLGKTPFYFDFNSSYTYFWRDEGLRGQRVTARPALSAVFQPGRLFDIQPEIGYRERLYRTSAEGPGYEREGLFDFSTRVGTRFSRVFIPDGEVVKKIRHSIEPEVVYTYIPPENQDHLPQFDALDDIGPENKITYALVNRFTSRLEPEADNIVYHEFLYLRLSQEYDIRESRRDRLNPQDELRPFSDIRAEAIIRPTRWSYLDLDALYDVNSKKDGFNNRFTVFNARGGVRDGAGNGLDLEYRYRRESLEYVAGDLDVAVLKPFYINYQHRYDIEEQLTLERVLNIEYRAQCWSVFLTLRDRLEDKEYLVTFALSGIGKVAELGGSLGSPEE
jgi:LPS-assembly protein